MCVQRTPCGKPLLSAAIFFGRFVARTVRTFYRIALSACLCIGALSYTANGAALAVLTRPNPDYPPAQSADGASRTVSGAAFKYKFENPRFYVPLIEIEVEPNGSARLRFKRGEIDDVIDRTMTLAPSTMSLLNDLVAASGFLTSTEEYQSKKDFSHLGWITIGVTRGSAKRTVRFNYTNHDQIAEMATILRAVADQQLDIFDIEIAVQNEQLDLPRVLDTLENDLSSGRLAEPRQLINTLQAIAHEDSLPLIARNHALRLAAAIEKGKYKSPFKPVK